MCELGKTIAEFPFLFEWGIINKLDVQLKLTEKFKSNFIIWREENFWYPKFDIETKFENLFVPKPTLQKD